MYRMYIPNAVCMVGSSDRPAGGCLSVTLSGVVRRQSESSLTDEVVLRLPIILITTTIISRVTDDSHQRRLIIVADTQHRADTRRLVRHHRLLVLHTQHVSRLSVSQAATLLTMHIYNNTKRSK